MDEDDFVLCILKMEIKKENVKMKVWFTEDVKQPLEAGMMCTIKGGTFHSFTNNRWIRDSGASYHITTMIPVCSMSLTQVDSRTLEEHASYEKRQTLCQHGRCIFPNMQTLAGKDNFK